MTVDDLLASLALPAQTRVDQRVAKKLLLDNGAPTAADKRAITDGIEELLWVAALKPATVGVPIYEDAERQYLEIAVLTLALRSGAKANRLRELIHRAIPYPVVLVTAEPDTITLSLAEIRHAQNEAGKMVLDGDVHAAALPDGLVGDAFRATLPLTGLPSGNLRLLYRGWLDRLTNLEVAGITGSLPQGDNAAQRRDALRTIRQLDVALVDLRYEAERETQINRRVELNLELKQREAERARLVALLG